MSTQKTQPYNSDFSEFFRNASADEQRNVHSQALKESTKMQNDLLKNAEQKGKTN